MTPSPSDPGRTASATAPPPECPAHGLDGVRQLTENSSSLYQELRAAHGTVAPVMAPGGVRAWLVLGYRENLAVLRTPSRFSSDSRISRAVREGLVDKQHPLYPVMGWQPLVAFADGPEHERLRGAVTRGLGRFNRHGVRRHVKRAADQLIDEFCTAGRADLVGQFSEQLPVLVLAHLLGMPEEDGPRLAEAIRDLLKGTSTAVASNEYVSQLLWELLQRKRADPGSDLASWQLEDEAGLSDAEIVEHLRHTLVAGYTTTASLIAETLMKLLADPQARANLAGGSMTLPMALDDCLWNNPPLQVLPARYATGDTILGGQRIEQGDMILLGLAAGNTDPEIRPDLAEHMYNNRSHLSFSEGPHQCPGGDIGRSIADTGIDTLLARLPDLHLATNNPGKLPRTRTWMSSHLNGLPVEFRARKPKQDQESGAATDLTPQSAPLPQPEPQPASAPALGEPRKRRWWKLLLRRR